MSDGPLLKALRKAMKSVDDPVAIGVAEEPEEFVAVIADGDVVAAEDRVVEPVERAASAVDLVGMNGQVPVAVDQRAEQGEAAGETAQRDGIAGRILRGR